MDEYSEASQGEPWQRAAADDTSGNAILEPALARYQDPVAADKLTKIQRDLDETKVCSGGGAAAAAAAAAGG
jgi:synaptobrevin family protein YKT6